VRGKAEHDSYSESMSKLGYEVNRAISKTIKDRPDAIDFSNRIVRELKSDAPSSQRLGLKQLARYKKGSS